MGQTLTRWAGEIVDLDQRTEELRGSVKDFSNGYQAVSRQNIEIICLHVPVSTVSNIPTIKYLQYEKDFVQIVSAQPS